METLCKHCGVEIVPGYVMYRGQVWLGKSAAEENVSMARYCNTDTEGYNQCHEPEEKLYTKKYEGRGFWGIYGKDGDYICSVISDAGAAKLISHLNRST